MHVTDSDGFSFASRLANSQALSAFLFLILMLLIDSSFRIQSATSSEISKIHITALVQRTSLHPSTPPSFPIHRDHAFLQVCYDARRRLKPHGWKLIHNSLQLFQDSDQPDCHHWTQKWHPHSWNSEIGWPIPKYQAGWYRSVGPGQVPSPVFCEEHVHPRKCGAVCDVASVGGWRGVIGGCHTARWVALRSPNWAVETISCSRLFPSIYTSCDRNCHLNQD